MAVQTVFGGEVAWVADIDPGACKILAHRFPGVPNLGDISKTNWAVIAAVDVMCMGFPCTDVSCAGAREGLREGNRSGVWNHCATAIGALRPPLVVIENVRGMHSAGADSNVEWCPWCLGEAGDEHALRASGAVLGDLADLGYDARWVTVSASDAGAPHKRERVFIVAWPAADTDCRAPERLRVAGVLGGAQAGEPGQGHQRQRPGHAAGGGGADAADTPGERRAGGDKSRAHLEHDGPEPAYTGAHGRAPGCPAADPYRAAGGERRLPAPRQAQSGRSRADAGGPSGAPAAQAAGNGRDEVGAGPDLDGRPVPAECSAPADTRGEGRQGSRHAGGEGRQVTAGHAPADADRGGLPELEERDSGPLTGVNGASGVDPLRRVLDWGAYGPAIARWEAVTGRPAPRPTEPGRTGERLSPRFVEWLMGLPAGWVTDVPGLTRNQQLHALGNGCVPQQVALALRLLLGAVSDVAA